jgi:hypothetical protein
MRIEVNKGWWKTIDVVESTRELGRCSGDLKSSNRKESRAFRSQLPVQLAPLEPVIVLRVLTSMNLPFLFSENAYIIHT